MRFREVYFHFSVWFVVDISPLKPQIILYRKKKIILNAALVHNFLCQPDLGKFFFFFHFPDILSSFTEERKTALKEKPAAVIDVDSESPPSVKTPVTSRVSGRSHSDDETTPVKRKGAKRCRIIDSDDDEEEVTTGKENHDVLETPKSKDAKVSSLVT